MPRFRTDDGIEVAAYDFGGNGPPLLFAHATGFHAHVWLPVVERMRDHFHCYALDSRGHGDSDPAPGGNYDWNGFAFDALAVVDGFGLVRPSAVGHSCGGALLLLAEEARPGTFAGLACYAPIVFPATLPAGAAPPPSLADGARRRRPVFASKDDAYRNYASKPPFERLHPDALRAYVEHGFRELPDGTVRLKCDPEHEARTFEMARHHGAYDALDRVRCPVALFSGDRDPAIPLAVLELLADRIGPLASAVELSDSDHFGPLVDPDRFAAIFRAALLRSPAPDAPDQPRSSTG